jgi:hypothetical protein
MKSLKEKFGKFEMSKERVKEVSGGLRGEPLCQSSTGLPGNDEDACGGSGNGSSGGAVRYLCARSSPSGLFEQQIFYNLNAGLAWAGYYPHWTNRGCSVQHY